jgi:RNA polymerase subunit RPABC4/transcription elongation factor Spt4
LPQEVKAPALGADDNVVTDEADFRCPHCGALLRSGAEWCTLCYTDLRPKPEPAPAVSVREPSYAGASTGTPVDPLTAPLSDLEAAAQALAEKSASGATPDTAADADPSAPAVGWPCSGCEAVVSFDDDACPACGTRFLEGARGEPDLLDRIGRGGLPVSTQSLIIAGGAAAMIAVIVAAMYIIGTLF